MLLWIQHGKSGSITARKHLALSAAALLTRLSSPATSFILRSLKLNLDLKATLLPSGKGSGGALVATSCEEAEIASRCSFLWDRSVRGSAETEKETFSQFLFESDTGWTRASKESCAISDECTQKRGCLAQITGVQQWLHPSFPRKMSSLPASVWDPGGMHCSFPKRYRLRSSPFAAPEASVTMHLCHAEMQRTAFQRKNGMCDHHGEKVVRRSVSTWLMEYFPVGRVMCSFLPGCWQCQEWDVGSAPLPGLRNTNPVSKQSPAPLISAISLESYQHLLLGSSS